MLKRKCCFFWHLAENSKYFCLISKYFRQKTLNINISLFQRLACLNTIMLLIKELERTIVKWNDCCQPGDELRVLGGETVAQVKYNEGHVYSILERFLCRSKKLSGIVWTGQSCTVVNSYPVWCKQRTWKGKVKSASRRFAFVTTHPSSSPTCSKILLLWLFYVPWNC